MRSALPLARLLLGALALACSVASPGQAQPAPRQGFRLERLASPPTSRDGFAVTLPSVLEHGVWSAQLSTGYQLAPLVLRDASEHAVVAHRLGGDFTGALGLWQRLELYARVPVTWLSVGESPNYEQRRFAAPGGFALGDVALGTTGLALDERGLSLGARAELLLPTGDRTQLAGDSALAPRLHGLASYTHEQLLVAVNGGYVYRPARDYAVARIGSELEWGAALRFDTRTDYELSLEAFGAFGLRDRAGPGAADTLDVLVGGRKAADTGMVRMRVGAALGGGFSAAYGDPALRAMLTLAVEPRTAAATPTRLPKDRDRDWVHDDRDECPRAAEDHDGFEDEDGCPDDDDDRDGVLDALDACPHLAGHFERGCPEPDADADRIPDAQDRCPEDAEDHDGDRDADGCPERDSDGDGLTDDLDACPDVPGSFAAEGCREHARFLGESIVLSRALEFEGAALAPGSAVLLEDVAALLKARPPVQAQLLVTAPTPELASAWTRALLADLTARGVEAGRLSALVQPAPGVGQVEIRLRAPPDSSARNGNAPSPDAPSGSH